MTCSNDITRLERTASENSGSSSDPVNRSYSARSKAMPSLSGEDANSDVTGKQALNALSSETKGDASVPSSYAKRTRSLITSGLVRGIIPTSMRRRSGQQILDSAFFELAGGGAETPDEGY